jgi:hypothetical protein
LFRRLPTKGVAGSRRIATKISSGALEATVHA